MVKYMGSFCGLMAIDLYINETNGIGKFRRVFLLNIGVYYSKLLINFVVIFKSVVM